MQPAAGGRPAGPQSRMKRAGCRLEGQHQDRQPAGPLRRMKLQLPVDTARLLIHQVRRTGMLPERHVLGMGKRTRRQLVRRRISLG